MNINSHINYDLIKSYGIKEGDFIFCIRPYFNNMNVEFKLNKTYEIRSIYDDGYILIYDDRREYYCGFELFNSKSSRYFFNYFSNFKQYRKLKIEKLNESRR